MPKPEIVVVEQTDEQKAAQKAEQDIKAEKEAQAFDSQGWDTDDDEAESSTKGKGVNEQNYGATAKGLINQGDVVKRLDADKKGNKWPIVEVRGTPFSVSEYSLKLDFMAVHQRADYACQTI
jgi:hypothetical protein